MLFLSVCEKLLLVLEGFVFPVFFFERIKIKWTCCFFPPASPCFQPCLWWVQCWISDTCVDTVFIAKHCVHKSGFVLQVNLISVGSAGFSLKSCISCGTWPVSVTVKPTPMWEHPSFIFFCLFSELFYFIIISVIMTTTLNRKDHNSQPPLIFRLV